MTVHAKCSIKLRIEKLLWFVVKTTVVVILKQLDASYCIHCKFFKGLVADITGRCISNIPPQTMANFKRKSPIRPTLTLCIIYRVSRGKCAKLRENVPYVKVHRYNPKHLSRS